ncbi:hypothetical protein Tco_1492418 [Tanacetum coccineum]
MLAVVKSYERLFPNKHWQLNTTFLTLYSSEWTYYVTHPPLVIGYDDDYQGEAMCDDQEDSLTTAMMLLARLCVVVRRHIYAASSLMDTEYSLSE